MILPLTHELGAGELAHGQPSALQQRSLDGYTGQWLASLGPRTPLGVVMKATRLAADLGDRDLHTRALDAALVHPNLPADVRAELELQRPLR